MSETPKSGDKAVWAEGKSKAALEQDFGPGPFTVFGTEPAEEGFWPGVTTAVG